MIPHFLQWRSSVRSLLRRFILPGLMLVAVSCGGGGGSPPPDTVLYNGRIVTVDADFSISEAVAVRGGRILAVGSSADVTALAGPDTRRIDLQGRTVLPGLHDNHVHPIGASTSELIWGELPTLLNIEAAKKWLREKVQSTPRGEWVVHPKMFITQVKDRRHLTLAELDAIAPDHPVVLGSLGYGGVINSAAMRAAGIDRHTQDPAVRKDPQTGEPTGFVQNFRMIASMPDRRAIVAQLSREEQLDYLEAMLKRYNQAGLTSITPGAGSVDENLRMFLDLKRQGRLTVRVFQNIYAPVDYHQPIEKIREELAALGYATGFGDEWVRIGAMKISMDGGFLTGTAFMRQPWGPRAGEIHGITDMSYRGVLRAKKSEIVPLITVANELGWKFTAHATGGGSVDELLDAYEEVNQVRPIRQQRFSVIHANFLTPDAIERMQRLGVYADPQPPFYFVGVDGMHYIMGEELIKTFHPYRSLHDAGVIVSGGSDHMVGLGDLTAINPYSPFLGMWIAITRTGAWGTPLTTEQAVTREEALRMYTINNAWATFEEDLKGSLEVDKLADLVVLSEDFLTCPETHIKDIDVLMTMVGGDIVYQSDAFEY